VKCFGSYLASLCPKEESLTDKTVYLGVAFVTSMFWLLQD